MTDHFSVIGIPRSAWLDPDDLKERFHRLGALHHPDAQGGSERAFTQLNAAWLALRDPAKCLRHYLELEHPESLAGIDRTPSELADLFMNIATLRQEAQRFAGQYSAASSPLSRALMEPERLDLRARIERLTAGINARIAGITAGLRETGTRPESLAKMLASLVFLEKWSSNLAETRAAL